MCGIVGHIGTRRLGLAEALKQIGHRGPDFSEIKEFAVGSSQVELGHARLAIVDLDARSNQPFHKCKDYWLAYNGEIYNHRELREELEGFGVKFLTRSDTEVLYEVIKEFGFDGLAKIDGMFAFCFVDVKKKEVTLGRDFLGIKQIYYSVQNGSFFCASEVKALKNIDGFKATIDEECLSEFLKFGFLLEPDTGWLEIKKVKPGQLIQYDIENGRLKDGREFPRRSKERKIGLQDEISHEIKKQLISDVKVGLFFSGGLDSSIILSQAGNIPSLVTTPHEKELEIAGITNDCYYARKIARFLNKEITEIDGATIGENLFSDIEFLVNMTEEPIADFTGISAYQLASTARRMGFKVMLSGMGADEVYGGYPRYQFYLYGRYFKWIYRGIRPFLKSAKKYAKKIERMDSYFNESNDFTRYISLFSPFLPVQQEKLLKRRYRSRRYIKKARDIWDSVGSKNRLSKAMNFDRFGFLSHNFIVADKSSMAASIELRVPLAIDFIFIRLMKNGARGLLSLRATKKPLRAFLLKILPRKLVQRPKAGFHPPLDEKINQISQEGIKKAFDNEIFREYFDQELVNEILDKHFRYTENNTFKIYRLLFINEWLKQNDP